MYQIKKTKLMKKFALISLMVLCITGITLAINLKDIRKDSQNKNRASINGMVTDLKTGEALAGVSVSIEGTDIKVYTDFDGNFEFKNLESGTYNIICSYISYKKSLIENIKINSCQNKIIETKLQPSK